MKLKKVLSICKTNGLYPRNGNSNSAHVGHFGQEASFCNHPQCPPPGPLLFYGKTAPRYCPLKKKERK